MSKTQATGTKTNDALARRLRYSRPNPKVRRLVLTEADYIIFEAIDRHGPLPSGILHEYTKHLRRDQSHLQNRLTELYNGDIDGGKPGGWLSRPPQQFANFEARYQHLVYGLAPRAVHILAEHGTLAQFAQRVAGSFVHQMMSACVAASIELGAASIGIRYISREEVFAHPKCAATAKTDIPLAIPLARPGPQTLIPDDLFGLQYLGAGYRFFAVEIDRATESIGRANGKGSFAAKIEAYRELLSTRRYREWWGIPNLTVLTVTTNSRRAAHIIEHIRRGGEPYDRFAFAVEPSFGANWRVPRQLLSDLLTRPWMTACGERSIDKA